MARIAILAFTEIRNDPRVMRHVQALNGVHEVVTCGKGPTPGGVVRHLSIPSTADHLPMTPAGLVALGLRRSRWAYRNLPAASAAIDLLAMEEFDLVIANDITALPAAIAVAGARPVIADLHEYAPKEMEEDWRWRLMVQPFAEHLCAEYLHGAAALITVADGIADEYKARFGVAAHTVTNAAPWRNPIPRPVGSPIRAVHSAMATPNRHLDETIRAISGLPGITLDLLLVPSPRAPRHLETLKRQAAKCDNVRILDPVPLKQLPSALDAYDIGIHVLRPVSFNHLHMLPNKFFDFVQSGLGVVIGPSPEMARLTERHGLGLVLPDFEGSTLRAALEDLDPEAVASWKRTACEASGALSSAREAERLRLIVAQVLG